jgi:hypothetical protein
MMPIMMEISCDQYDEMLRQQEEDRKRIEELESLIDEIIVWDSTYPSTSAGYRPIVAKLRKAREGPKLSYPDVSTRIT